MFKTPLFFLVSVLAVLVCLCLQFFVFGEHQEQLTFSQLHTIIRDKKTDQIERVIITNGSQQIGVKLVGSDRTRNVVVPQELKEKLINELEDANVGLEVCEGDKSSFWFSMISSFFLPILLLVGFMFMFRAAQRTR